MAVAVETVDLQAGEEVSATPTRRASATEDPHADSLIRKPPLKKLVSSAIIK